MSSIMIDGVMVDDSQNYSLKTKIVGNYRVSKLIPISGGQSFNIPLGSGTSQTQFEIIGNNVFNLSQSRLMWTTTHAGGPTSATTNICMWADPLAQLSRVTLSTRSGLILADIQDVAFFSRMVTSVKTKSTDLFQRSLGGYVDGAQTFATTDVLSLQAPIQGIQMSNDSLKATQLNAIGVTTATSTANAVAVTPIAGVFTGLATGACNARPGSFDTPGTTATAPTEPQLSDIEPRQCVFSPANTAFSCSYQLNLGEVFHHTLFANSQDLYFNENVIFTLTFGCAQSFGWLATTTTSPVNYTAILDKAVTVNNLALYVSIQTNPECINLITHKVNSTGLEIVTPYIYLQKYTNSGASTNLQQRFNRSMGSNLLRTYFSVFSTKAQSNCILDNSNVGGTRVSTYYSAVNSLRLQEFSPTVGLSEDWMLNQSLLNRSAVLSINQYRYQWVHIDSWTNGNNPICETDDTVIGGLDLTDEKTYTINATVDGGRLSYLYAIVQRKLIIKPGMMMFA